VGYWEAAIVIESLLWLANVAVGVFVLYRVVTVRVVFGVGSHFSCMLFGAQPHALVDLCQQY